FFASRAPDIAAQTNAAKRRQTISALAQTNPRLHAAYHNAVRNSEGISHILRSSGRFPLCGRGDVNTYAVFAELATTLLAGSGRSGIIVPSGIATDTTTSGFFSWLSESRRIASVYDFENRDRELFP